MTSAHQMSSRKPPVPQSTFGFPDDSASPPRSTPYAQAHKLFPVLWSVPSVAFGRARERSSNSLFRPSASARNPSLFWSPPPKVNFPFTHRPRFSRGPLPLPPGFGLRQSSAAFRPVRPLRRIPQTAARSSKPACSTGTSHPQLGNFPLKTPAIPLFPANPTSKKLPAQPFPSRPLREAPFPPLPSLSVSFLSNFPKCRKTSIRTFIYRVSREREKNIFTPIFYFCLTSVSILNASPPPPSAMPKCRHLECTTYPRSWPETPP